MEDFKDLACYSDQPTCKSVISRILNLSTFSTWTAFTLLRKKNFSRLPSRTPERSPFRTDISRIPFSLLTPLLSCPVLSCGTLDHRVVEHSSLFHYKGGHIQEYLLSCSDVSLEWILFFRQGHLKTESLSIISPCSDSHLTWNICYYNPHTIPLPNN